MFTRFINNLVDPYRFNNKININDKSYEIEKNFENKLKLSV